MDILDSHPDLEALSLAQSGPIYWELHTPQLYEHAVRNDEGLVAHLGPLVVETTPHVERSHEDKYIVDDTVDIWPQNQLMRPEAFESHLQAMTTHLAGKPLYVQNCYSGTDVNHRLPLRVITELAWHNLFARNIFVRSAGEPHHPQFTLLHAPGLAHTLIAISVARRLILIGGTAYAGEIKKAVFTVMNYLLPQQGVLSMHCSANEGDNNDVALFFGLSGSGKTTLSLDAARTLIGDDAHGWSPRGVFNIEGGSHARVIRLNPVDEPEVYQTTRRFGTVLENVAIDHKSRRLDLDDASITENTRACYPISHIPNASRVGLANHPDNILFLVADAFGVLPPVSKLTPEQASYHFLSGYNPDLVDGEPHASFSACFGAPFLPLHPTVYAALLSQLIAKHGTQVWLVNTGWTTGTRADSERIAIAHSRAILRAIFDGFLAAIETTIEPYFGLHVPAYCPGVPDDVLHPHWADSAAYERTARALVAAFQENFATQFGQQMREGGPA